MISNNVVFLTSVYSDEPLPPPFVATRGSIQSVQLQRLSRTLAFRKFRYYAFQMIRLVGVFFACINHKYVFSRDDTLIIKNRFVF